jgi:hypothetical protein
MSAHSVAFNVPRNDEKVLLVLEVIAHQLVGPNRARVDFQAHRMVSLESIAILVFSKNLIFLRYRSSVRD